jgi:hypothetical protein
MIISLLRQEVCKHVNIIISLNLFVECYGITIVSRNRFWYDYCFMKFVLISLPLHGIRLKLPSHHEISLILYAATPWNSYWLYYLFMELVLLCLFLYGITSDTIITDQNLLRCYAIAS